MEISFHVAGEPVSQGSKKAFYFPKIGRSILVDASAKLKPWRSLVSMHAQEAMKNLPQFQGPVEVSVTFWFARPKSHYGTGKNAAMPKMDAPMFKASAPDCDKLLRAIMDSMSAIVYKDDSQVCRTFAEKRYTPGAPGASITVKDLEVGK